MRFALKRFEDIALGDVLSAFVNGPGPALYRVYRKTEELELARSNSRCAPNNHRYWEHRRRTLSMELESTKTMTRTFGTTGLCEIVERSDTATIDADSVHIGVPQILTVSAEGMRHTLLKDAKRGDCIISLLDGEAYTLHDQGTEYSHEYGGTTYNWTFFEALDLNGKRRKMYYGGLSMHSQNFYPVRVGVAKIKT